jgi:hypothetical protein
MKSETETEAHLRMQRDNLREERKILIALISKIFPSVLYYHTSDEGGNDHGRSTDGIVCYVSLPTGQVSFHVGEDKRSSWFEHLTMATITPWDRHGTDEKWRRVVEFIDMEEAP